MIKHFIDLHEETQRQVVLEELWSDSRPDKMRSLMLILTLMLGVMPVEDLKMVISSS
jgi:hypothetical protein